MKSKIHDIKGITITRPMYRDDVEIIVKGDWNDGDYVSETNFVSVATFTRVLPIFRKILSHSSRYGHNWEYSERTKYLTGDEIDLVWDLIPYGDSNSEGCHTVKDIQCYYRSSDAIRYEIDILPEDNGGEQ